jgi:predicted 3-demethylubiquinone-9 3-methyltransferase (glyoxalase superfamily)
MPGITPNLWFDGNAEEAAAFYVATFPASRIVSVNRAAAANPSTPAGAVLTVDFVLDGHPFAGINGGPDFTFSEAVSFAIECRDQAEVDRYWEALVERGGSHGRCGWLKDRFGVSWQVVPRRLQQLLDGPDREGAARAMEAMLGMGKLDVAELETAYAGERTPQPAR